MVLTRSGMYHWSHEPCFYGWFSGGQPKWYGKMDQRTVWEVGHDHERVGHPTQKPAALFFPPIHNHTLRGEIVYEPFSGSGTQLIAASRTGRLCRAVEIEPKYVDIAVRRWERFTGEQAVLDATGKTFDQIAADRGVAMAKKVRGRVKASR
jgi:DNA modification methylase